MELLIHCKRRVRCVVTSLANDPIWFEKVSTAVRRKENPLLSRVPCLAQPYSTYGITDTKRLVARRSFL